MYDIEWNHNIWLGKKHKLEKVAPGLTDVPGIKFFYGKKKRKVKKKRRKNKKKRKVKKKRKLKRKKKKNNILYIYNEINWFTLHKKRKFFWNAREGKSLKRSCYEIWGKTQFISFED